MEKFQEHANLFKALMHPFRLAILYMLQDGEQCVCHMEAAFGCRQSYISQQLSVLKEAGLIQDRRDGWNIFYRVVKPEIFALLGQAEEIVGKAGGLAELQESAKDSCPCPKCSHALIQVSES